MLRSKRFHARAHDDRSPTVHRAPWGATIRLRRSLILAAWSRDVRFVPVADASMWLDDVIDRATQIDAGRGPSRPVPAFERTIEVSIGEIVGHYAALREAIAQVLDRDLSATS